MSLDDYYAWRPLARAVSRTIDDADDLLQACLLIAAQQGRLDFSIEQNRQWFTGVLKNQAALRARSAVRRKQREQHAAPATTVEAPSAEAPEAQAAVYTSLLEALTPATRQVMTLVLLGLNRKEVCAVLDITPVTLRQRLTTLRKALRTLPEDLQREALALAYQRHTERADDLAIGLIRRALLRVLQDGQGLGLHDPDGHLFVITPQ